MFLFHWPLNSRKGQDVSNKHKLLVSWVRCTGPGESSPGQIVSHKLKAYPRGNEHIQTGGMFEDDFLFPRLDMLVSSRIYFVFVHSFVDCSHFYLIGSRYITLHGEQRACIISNKSQRKRCSDIFRWCIWFRFKIVKEISWGRRRDICCHLKLPKIDLSSWELHRRADAKVSGPTC